MRKWMLTLSAVALLVAAAVAVTWQYSQRALRACVVDETLQPVAALLEENRRILAALQSQGHAASESALLESYLRRIRSDGVPRHSAMKQQIDRVVNNNTVIVALLSKYAPHARTPAFSTAADQYRDYAIAFRDRWQSVFEIFMAGGNLPRSGPAFPDGIVEAVAQELR